MIDVAEIHPAAGMAKDKFEPLAREIFALKKQLNAVILAHNYQVSEIQDVETVEQRHLSSHHPHRLGDGSIIHER